MESRKQNTQKNARSKKEVYIPLSRLLNGAIEIPNLDEVIGDPTSFIFGAQWTAANAAWGFGVIIEEPERIKAERREAEEHIPTVEDIYEMVDYLSQQFSYRTIDKERAVLRMTAFTEDLVEDGASQEKDEEDACRCDCCCDDCFCDEESVDDVVESLHEAADGHGEYMEKTGKTVEGALAEAVYVIDALREELNNSRDEISKLEKQVGRLEGLVISHRKNGFGGKGA